jgi:hypothetical protein
VLNKKKNNLGAVLKELHMKKFNLFVSMLIIGMLLGSSTDAQISPKIYASDTFIVEEYPIARMNLYDNTSVHMKKREKWRTPSFNLLEINRKLSSLGYHFVQACPDCSVDFYKGKILIMGGMVNLRGFSMDSKGQHFTFFASKLGGRFPASELVCINGEIQRCTKEKMHGWGQLGPCYVNNDLVWCEVFYKGDTIREVNLAHWEGRVRNAKRVLFEFSFEYGAGSMPVHFEAFDGSWLLQIDDGRVILNGEDLCKKYGYSRMWRYRFLKGKPFFFFTPKGDEKIRLSYNGKELPHLWYDFVGDNGGWKVFGNGVMVWFGAVRGDQWYYVEAGMYK